MGLIKMHFIPKSERLQTVPEYFGDCVTVSWADLFFNLEKNQNFGNAALWPAVLSRISVQ